MICPIPICDAPAAACNMTSTFTGAARAVAIGDSCSSLVEADFTMVQSGNIARSYSWYDNEWGSSCRIADLVAYMAHKGL